MVILGKVDSRNSINAYISFARTVILHKYLSTNIDFILKTVCSVWTSYSSNYYHW